MSSLLPLPGLSLIHKTTGYLVSCSPLPLQHLLLFVLALSRGHTFQWLLTTLAYQEKARKKRQGDKGTRERSDRNAVLRNCDTNATATVSTFIERHTVSHCLPAPPLQMTKFYYNVFSGSCHLPVFFSFSLSF